MGLLGLEVQLDLEGLPNRLGQKLRHLQLDPLDQSLLADRLDHLALAVLRDPVGLLNRLDQSLLVVPVVPVHQWHLEGMLDPLALVDLLDHLQDRLDLLSYLL